MSVCGSCDGLGYICDWCYEPMADDGDECRDCRQKRLAREEDCVAIIEAPDPAQMRLPIDDEK